MRILALSLSLTLLLAASARAQSTPPPEPAQSQPPAPRPLSLDQALELAQDRSEQVTIAKAGVDRANGQRALARSNLFPQLSATASYNRALASEFSGIFDSAAAGPTCAAFMPDPSGSVEARLVELERAVNCGATGETSSTGLGNLPFGRKNTYRIDLSFSQNVYPGAASAPRQPSRRRGDPRPTRTSRPPAPS